MTFRSIPPSRCCDSDQLDSSSITKSPPSNLPQQPVIVPCIEPKLVCEGVYNIASVDFCTIKPTPSLRISTSVITLISFIKEFRSRLLSRRRKKSRVSVNTPHQCDDRHRNPKTPPSLPIKADVSYTYDVAHQTSQATTYDSLKAHSILPTLSAYGGMYLFCTNFQHSFYL